MVSNVLLNLLFEIFFHVVDPLFVSDSRVFLRKKSEQLQLVQERK